MIKVDMPSKTPSAQQASAKESAIGRENIAPAGAVAGVAMGAIAGSALGWMLGMYILTIPNIADFIWTGPIIAAITGFGMGGLIGGAIGALIGMVSPTLGRAIMMKQSKGGSSQTLTDESHPGTGRSSGVQV